MLTGIGALSSSPHRHRPDAPDWTFVAYEIGPLEEAERDLGRPQGSRSFHAQAVPAQGADGHRDDGAAIGCGSPRPTGRPGNVSRGGDAKAFWSATLYDTKQGFFIPNEQKKYSVGQNAGMKLNASGGIEIHVAAKQPKGVPAENWLPITREDLGIDRKVSRRPSSTLASAAGRMPAFFVANSNRGNSPGIAHVRIPRSTPVESTFRCRRRGTA